MEATLSRTDGSETVRLGAADSASWGAVWSPDGRRVVFYSDEGGEAGLWIWERESSARHRVGDFVVRPFFGFETVRWAADSRRLLVKLLPEETTLPEANALMPTPQADLPAPEIVPGEPSVEVRLSTAAREAAGGSDDEEAPPAGRMEEYRRGLAADLAVVDIETGEVERIVRGETVRRYAFSPAGRFVAYSVLTGFVPETQQSLYDLRLHDLEPAPVATADRVLAEDVTMAYGIEWSWSPAGDRLAYTSSGQVGEGHIVVLPIPAGEARVLENEAPRFSPGEGEVPPIWSADGGTLYGVGEGALWRVDPESGEAEEVARIEGWDLRSLVTPSYGSAVAWTDRSDEGDDRRGYGPGSTGKVGLPLVVWVYGGQLGSRSVGRFGFWGHLPTFNMHVLASRGYAVLAPDAPLRPGHVTEDLVATVLPGVDAAVEQGFADPERLAIMDQSFGALNTLALLTRTDRFRAAVITAAVQHPDLFADYLTGMSTGYYETGQGGMEESIWEVPERYRENSPLFDFPDIETPVLIGQGDQDGDLVPVNAIFAALERLGKQVELRIYRGENHVITRDANVIDFWQRRLEFLARHLELETGPDGRVRPSG